MRLGTSQHAHIIIQRLRGVKNWKAITMTVIFLFTFFLFELINQNKLM